MTELRAPTVDELAAVQAVEQRAATAFVAIGMPEPATWPPSDRATLEDARADGRLTVAVDGGVIVGFVLVSRHGDEAHLDEIDVAPEAARRGLGRRLVEHAIAWARGQGCTAIALTTFRDVPWNAPFYARCGFVEIAAPLPPRLAAIRAAERARGLDVAPRIAMARPITARD